jgi:hypothetical protein
VSYIAFANATCRRWVKVVHGTNYEHLIFAVYELFRLLKSRAWVDLVHVYVDMGEERYSCTVGVIIILTIYLFILIPQELNV